SEIAGRESARTSTHRAAQRASMKIARHFGDIAPWNVEPFEVPHDDVDHLARRRAVLPLDVAHREQNRGVHGGQAIRLEDAAPEHAIDESRLVLERHEDDAAR